MQGRFSVSEMEESQGKDRGEEELRVVVAHSQQQNRDLSATTQRNGILPTI